MGLNVEWWSQPTAEELSVRLIIFMPLSDILTSSIDRENSTVATAAINSRRLIEV
jgi:hypothetical protein